jgi:hypothetical protein
VAHKTANGATKWNVCINIIINSIKWYIVGLQRLTKDGNNCPLTGNFIHILRTTRRKTKIFKLLFYKKHGALYYFSTHGRVDSLMGATDIISEIATGANFLYDRIISAISEVLQSSIETVN